MSSSSSDHYYDRLKDEVLWHLLYGPARKLYVGAWKGVGATALLRRVTEAFESKKRKLDTVIKVVRPAPFENPREIQRAVAKQLDLLPSVMAAFDEADEDDDFRGEEFSSRGMLSEVAWETYRTVKDRSVLLVLCNNLADGSLIDTDDLRIPIGWWGNNTVLWTFGTNTSKEAESTSAGWTVRIQPPNEATALHFLYLEAVEIARYIDESSNGSLQTTPQIVLRCFWYCLLLRRAFDRSVLDDRRPLEAGKYFVCDGILEGDHDAAWEIGKAISPVIRPVVNNQLQYWEETFSNWTPKPSDLLPPKTLLIDSVAHKDWVKSLSEEESYRWISVCSLQSNVPGAWDFFKVYRSSIMSNVSSSFWHFEERYKALPNDFFHYFSNVRVLDLLGCVVSPIDSSFLRLRNLRMLRLEQCKVIAEQSSVDPSSLLSVRKGRQEPKLFDSLWVLNLYNSDVDKFLLAGKAFELMPNLRELDLKDETSVLHPVARNELRERMHKLQVLKLSGNINTKFLPRCLSMEISLEEPIPNNCKKSVSLPATNETIGQQSCPSLGEVELVDPAASLPILKTFHLSHSQLITKLSLRGCRKLENVDLHELMELEVLDLSCTAIKVLDISKLPRLKQLFLLGCEQLHRVLCPDERLELDVLYLDNYSNSRTSNVDRCLDSFRNQQLRNFTRVISDADQRLFHAHVVVKDVRLFRSLKFAFPDLSNTKALIHIHIKSSSTIKRGINIDTAAKLNATITATVSYADVLDTKIDRRHRHHLTLAVMPLNNHIEVDGGINSWIVNELAFDEMMIFANSLFVHDNTSDLALNFHFKDLKCFRIERCPNMDFVFGTTNADGNYLEELESIWFSHLPRLKALCEQIRVRQLKHIYLEYCARLKYVLPSLSELHNLETISICYCSDLMAVFIDYDDKEDKRGATTKLLPKLRSIHLQELPKLQHIYESNIRAPMLQELKFRGCYSLRKLPLFDRSDTSSMRAIKISCEKDWWDKLQWDGLESNHHSSLFNPKHCPYYKKPMKARWL